MCCCEELFISSGNPTSFPALLRCVLSEEDHRARQPQDIEHSIRGTQDRMEVTTESKAYILTQMIKQCSHRYS